MGGSGWEEGSEGAVLYCSEGCAVAWLADGYCDPVSGGGEGPHVSEVQVTSCIVRGHVSVGGVQVTSYILMGCMQWEVQVTSCMPRL